MPGVETNTGPLGHRFPVAVGIALSARLQASPRRTFVVLGDGELQEGSNSEAAMTAAHYGLSALTAIVDRNRLQQGARTEETKQLDPRPRPDTITIVWPPLNDFAPHFAPQRHWRPDGGRPRSEGKGTGQRGTAEIIPPDWNCPASARQRQIGSDLGFCLRVERRTFSLHRKRSSDW